MAYMTQPVLTYLQHKHLPKTSAILSVDKLHVLPRPRQKTWPSMVSTGSSGAETSGALLMLVPWVVLPTMRRAFLR